VLRSPTEEIVQPHPWWRRMREYLVEKLYPNGMYCPTCGKVTKHHRETNRPSYACQYCGHHEHPLVGTIFENSATSLRLWFYAIYLMSSTRCGISAKQLERELGVTYKTAWRTFHKIRSLLTQDDNPFSGSVEMDEAYIGGKAKWRRGRGALNKTPVFGMAQRKEDDKLGQIAVKVVADAKMRTLMPHFRSKVLPKSVVYTDEWPTYDILPFLGYQHERIPHAQKVFVSGDVHMNTIEGFWSHLKRGISSVYREVSTKHLQSYLDEYVFRYNNRGNERGLFMAFLERIEKIPGQNPDPSAISSSS
jgi:transposase-like protein